MYYNYIMNMEIDNSNYTPVEPNVYYYKPLLNNFLDTNLDDFLMSNKIKQINICSYEVNNEGKFPFLKFLLTNNNVDNVLSFPYIPYYDSLNSEQLINFTKILLFGLVSLENANFDDFNMNIIFNGFYDFENELYLFIDLTNYKANINDIYTNSESRFVLIDEILNQGHVCNITIDNCVSRFFTNNSNFCVLLDKNGENYEIPVACYVGQEEKKLNFTYTFGVSKKNNSFILGPYYYFTNFTNAVEEISLKNENNSDIKKNKNGVIRFAVFMGTTKWIDNLPNDTIDTSDIKLERLNDEALDNSYERLTMRISDHQGKWAETFDSCYLGSIELDNGEYLKNTPLLVVKEYNQQIPLSYHFINKSKLKLNYNEKQEYFII